MLLSWKDERNDGKTAPPINTPIDNKMLSRDKNWAF